MEHLDGPCVPVWLEAHVAVNLHEVLLTIIITLSYMSSVERVPSLGVLDCWHNNFRRIFAAYCFVYHFFDCSIMLLVPLMVYIHLIVNDDVQVLGFFSLDDHISQSVRNLRVSIRCYGHIKSPILWNRNRNKVFLDNLVEPDCYGKVVVTKSRSNLMLDKLAFE